MMKEMMLYFATFCQYVLRNLKRLVTNQKDASSLHKGFTNWKDATGRFWKHEASDYHNDAYIKVIWLCQQSEQKYSSYGQTIRQMLPMGLLCEMDFISCDVLCTSMVHSTHTYQSVSVQEECQWRRVPAASVSGHIEFLPSKWLP